MCGIIGYVGQKPCVNFIYDGLQRLEYRGYDSAGIAVLSKNKKQHEEVILVKSEGKLTKLQPKLAELPAESTIGIGHTRWATHGSPTTENAHPHALKDLAIIHNGIIENYRELKEELLAQGVKFESQTDSEVVLHLLDRAIRESGDIKNAIVKTLTRLRGAYAVTIMSAKEPDALYVVKQGSPVVIGLGDSENYLASDALALIAHTPRVIFLTDGQFAKLTSNNAQLWDFEGKTLELPVTTLNWSATSIEKAGYRHFMLKEIHEQQHMIAKTIDRLVDRKTMTIKSEEMGLSALNLADIKSINIVACGSAYHAGLMGKYFFEPLLNIPVHVELASEFRYRAPYLDPSSLTIAVSQSGETLDTLESVKYAASKNSKILSVCNVRFSSIPRASHATFYMEAGPEIGVASTKAFTSQILCLYLLGLEIASKTKKLSESELKVHLTELQLLPPKVEQAVGCEKDIEEIANRFYEVSHCLFIGRGESYPIAMEGALKLKEISYIHAESYAGGELKHGPIALIDRHMPIVAIAPNDKYLEKMISNVEEIRAREGQMIVVGDPKNQHLKKLSQEFIPVPESKISAQQAILTTIPLQLLSYYMAVKRGTDVDQPRNLAKSVTVE
jgi:glucosamine--fructose-6-phosphate aminotransferase (isomerizing)